ncbi:hypothetical protein EVAR_60915_1 [Eumeta japonica]|uniref:Uncharacterized protein n=1 Tax=Eumeta variegata TaxID=151549 RepID=A0A4C1ZIF8_EUMVA|nr:hypothetical protein EVAR_60915_1 [Eumeta japonica]
MELGRRGNAASGTRTERQRAPTHLSDGPRCSSEFRWRRISAFTHLLRRLSILIPSRVPDKKGLDRQTDGQQSDPIRVPFFPFEVRNPKKEQKINLS